MKRKHLLFVTILLVLSLAIVASVSAITDGELDGDGHPMVGLMMADDAEGNPLWRCSGALLSPTLFLTAGHCTEPPAVRATIWFESDVQSGIPDNGYPLGGATSVDGTAYVHPQYDPAAFFLLDQHVLGEAGRLPLDQPEHPDHRAAGGARPVLLDGAPEAAALPSARHPGQVLDLAHFDAELLVLRRDGCSGGWSSPGATKA